VSDPTRGGGSEPTEAEVQAYLEQLRGAPVDQVVAEVASALLNAAQVKLGRQDGRLLIDLVAALTDAGRDRFPAELTSQLEQALTQLRMAQVEAEQQVASSGGEEGDLPADGASGDGAASAGDAAASPPPSTPPSSGGGAAASRLWTPGG
jgi:hypothetical protein